MRPASGKVHKGCASLCIRGGIPPAFFARGPGAEGASLALNASGFFRSDITDNFDIIGWDPRGTGQSEGVVDCIDDD